METKKVSDVYSDAILYAGNWPMPPADRVLVDDKYAVIQRCDLCLFSRYDLSDPTGIWIGKRWLRQYQQGLFMLEMTPYGESRDKCWIKAREVLILD